MKTNIINLYSGPGTGKSTSAAYIFYALKSQAINAELVREYVKDWAWEKRHISAYDQIYFLGKQSRNEARLYGKVDWITTDCPVWLSAFYAQKYCPIFVAEGVRAATVAFYHQAAEDGYKHHHVFLRRTKPYLAEGRFQTAEEAKDMDVEMKNFLKAVKVPYIECDTSEDSLKDLLVKVGAQGVNEIVSP